MAVYAIGDVQGCFDELRGLLDALAFDPARDRLWFAGDLVNRGPQSLQTLRFVKELGDAAVTVLGNHDLHLLALSAGNQKHADNGSLTSVLEADDCDELMHWLRQQPLLHHDPALGFTMIHAGLPPQWDLDTARACARELEDTLRGEDFTAYCQDMYGNKPKRWSPKLKGMDRLRFITNCLTRMRYCSKDGSLKLKPKGPPGSQPRGTYPWYAVPGRASASERLLFGHWSTLGYLQSDNVWALDTGCLWGGQLTALRIDLDEPKPLHLPCPGQRRPGG